MSQKNPVLVSFGNLLRSIREEVGLSQENLALKAGLHRNYIGILERGEQNPSLLVMLKISKALGVTLAELLAKLPADIINFLDAE
jgi:transcriptional regulator with XRE-family HTH domain